MIFPDLYSFVFCNRVLVVKTKRHDTAKISLKQKHRLKSPDQIYDFILSNSKQIFYLSLKIHIKLHQNIGISHEQQYRRLEEAQNLK